MPRLLLAEDDHDIAEPLARALRHEGYEVVEAVDGAAALRAVLADPPDLIVLDVGLPEMDGFEVCRAVRELHPRLPILMLTARDGELDTVAGLDAGADDYVTKPFRLSELLARLRAMLRHSSPPQIVAGPITVDTATRRAFADGAELDLTPKEFELLAVFAAQPGQAIRRERIMDEVWDPNWFGSTKTLDVHVSSLRRKLGDVARIEAVRSIGYRLEIGAACDGD
jgi:DNA-binding response OmpR family regulator